MEAVKAKKGLAATETHRAAQRNNGSVVESHKKRHGGASDKHLHGNPCSTEITDSKEKKKKKTD